MFANNIEHKHTITNNIARHLDNNYDDNVIGPHSYTLIITINITISTYYWLGIMTIMMIM